MFKTLIYGGKRYKQFAINEDGEIKNKKTNHIYKKTVNQQGYYTVTLPMGKRGIVKCIRVHKALAEVFIPNPKRLPVVNHIDENKLNIKLENLEWVTSKTNTNLYIKNRLKENELSCNRKLTKFDVEYIRKDKISSNAELARWYGVSKVTISYVRRGLSYKNLGE